MFEIWFSSLFLPPSPSPCPWGQYQHVRRDGFTQNCLELGGWDQSFTAERLESGKEQESREMGLERILRTAVVKARVGEVGL